MTHVCRLAIAVAAALGMMPRPADACSCAPDRFTIPADGATDVPTNVAIVMRERSSELSDELVLMGPDGPVDLEVVLVHDRPTTEIVRPLLPLEPLTEYTLQPGFLEVRFTTGDGPDGDAPEPVDLGQLSVAHARVAEGYGYGCGDEFSFIDLPMTAPADAVAVDLFVDRDGVRAHYLVPADRAGRRLSNWDSGCEMLLSLEPEQVVCFEARTRDQAGNLGPPVQRCATVTACADIVDPENFGYDLSGCEPPPEAPPAAGCRAVTAPALPLPLAALLLAYAVRRSARYARKWRIAARADSRSPARS